METYKPIVLRPCKKIKRKRMYGIGESDGKGGYGMWAGPVPDENTMLETVGHTNNSCIIKFNESGTDEVIWRWNTIKEVWLMERR